MSRLTSSIPQSEVRPAALLLGFSTRNPERFVYDNGFLEGDAYVDRVNAGTSKPTGWTIGNRRHLSLFVGCPVFLVRTGQVNPGLIMSGVLTSGTIQQHGGANRVLLQWERALRWRECKALPLETVFGARKGGRLRGLLHQSGVPLEREEAATLATKWRRFFKAAKMPRLTNGRGWPQLGDDLQIVEGKRDRRSVSRFSRYRNLRAILLNKKFPPRCAVCDLDPAKFYGARVGDILEAHHLIPLSGGRRETRERDVRLVCPNCHRALHTSQPPLNISQLRKLVGSQARG